MNQNQIARARVLLAWLGLLWSLGGQATLTPDTQESSQPPSGALTAPVVSQSPWTVHGDETLMDQYHGHFYSARPDGPNSFSSAAANSYSSVAGIGAGYRWESGLEGWARVESIRGIPFSEAGGLAALTNNDMQRIMENHFTSYLALAYLSRGWELGEPSNQPAGESGHGLQEPQERGNRRFRLVVGKLDVLSMFDSNTYAHKGDDQFLNWCFMTHCAYDFAADARGYTWGAAGLLDWDEWSGRVGWFAMPRLPNQLEIDGSMGQHFGINGELERRWNKGDIKLLVYQGRMRLSNFGQFADSSGVYILNSTKYDARRGGAGLNLEQELIPEVGFFARMFRDGGSSETMAFTEADRSASAGVSLDGALWHRPQDGIGIGWVRNGINAARKQFLQQGNYDLFIGDGYLAFAPEMAIETYYRYALGPGIHLTLDWQGIENPAYNALRGPLSVWGMRLHAEF